MSIRRRVGPGHHRRRWLRFTVGAAVAAVVLAVGGPLVYIHLVQGKAPAALALPAAATATAGTAGTAGPSGSAPAGAPLAGSWTVSAGSQAGYRVKEVLFGQDTTAVGRTTAVTGGMAVIGTTVRTASFTVALASVRSDQSRRDGQFRGHLLDTADFPTATFTLTAPVDLVSVPALGVTRTFTVVGVLRLHGVTRSAVATLTARRSAAAVDVSGSVPVVFARYGIQRPDFGFVRTDDHGLIEVLLHLTRR